MTTRIKTYPPPTCPRCGAQMKLRRPREGHAMRFKPFWGCATFPACQGVRDIDENGDPEYADDERPWGSA